MKLGTFTFKNTIPSGTCSDVNYLQLIFPMDVLPLDYPATVEMFTMKAGSKVHCYGFNTVIAENDSVKITFLLPEQWDHGKMATGATGREMGSLNSVDIRWSNTYETRSVSSNVLMTALNREQKGTILTSLKTIPVLSNHMDKITKAMTDNVE